MRTAENPRITNTEHLYKFRKNHQKKRIKRKRTKKVQPPVYLAKILTGDGIATIGEVSNSDGKDLIVLGKGVKTDSERGRCVVFKLNPTEINSPKSNLILERTR